MTRLLVPVDVYAAMKGRTPKTVRNWASRGYFSLYQLPGERAVQVDVDEADAAIAALPATRIRRPHTRPRYDGASVVKLAMSADEQARHDEAVKRVVDSLPPLSTAQIERVAALLRASINASVELGTNPTNQENR